MMNRVMWSSNERAKTITKMNFYVFLFKLKFKYMIVKIYQLVVDKFWEQYFFTIIERHISGGDKSSLNIAG